MNVVLYGELARTNPVIFGGAEVGLYGQDVAVLNIVHM